jgi:hypothetical protein
MPFVASAAALLVVALYVVWRAYRWSRLRREQRLRHRVAYLLWVMAEQDEPRPFGRLSGFYRVVSN